MRTKATRSSDPVESRKAPVIPSAGREPWGASAMRTTRRDFLIATTGLTLIGPAAARKAGAGCLEPSLADGVETADIVIVGSGGAGLSAALAAREKMPGRIVILEKMTVPGGNTRFSCGFFNAVDPERQRPDGIVDSLEKHIADTIRSGRGLADPALVELLCERALDTLHWLEALGVRYESRCTQIYGGLFPRSHLPILPEAVESYVDILIDAARTRGIEILTGKTVRELLTEECGGKGGSRETGAARRRVTGVRYRDEEGSIKTLRARAAVILAAGGYAANADLCRLHDPRLVGLCTTNAAGSTGEVMLAAQRAGAYLTGCDFVECIPLHVHYARFAIMVERAIFVDQMGERFVREDDRRDTLRDKILALPNRHGFVIVDNDGFLSCPPSFQRQLKVGLERQEVFSADTLEELAQLLRVPASNLGETVRRYNRFVAAGADTDFGRSPQSLRYPIVSPPFWACLATMSRHHTMGGVAIDRQARVLDWDARPIEALYAAGEITGGIHGANRLGGNAICDIHVFGRLAGEEAAARALAGAAPEADSHQGAA